MKSKLLSYFQKLIMMIYLQNGLVTRENSNLPKIVILIVCKSGPIDFSNETEEMYEAVAGPSSVLTKTGAGTSLGLIASSFTPGRVLLARGRVL